MNDDDSTIGTRLRELRRWRRMTLAEVAGLAGISTSYLSMAERGLRSLDRRSLISALATALRVSETELTGGPHLGSDPLQSGPHAAIPALREALQTSNLGSAAVDRARPLAEIACEVTSRIVPMRANADYAGAGALLPSVLDELHWHAAQDKDEASRRLAMETLVEACVVAGLIVKDLGYLDLAHVAVLRAEAAADLLDDPVQRGKAGCLRIWAFPRERSWDRRLAVAESAAEDLEPHARTPLSLHVLGMLTLHAALGAAVVQRPDVVSHWLAEAGQIASRVPDDMAGNWQFFSQSNVRLWSVAIAVERGEGGRAVLELASGADPAKLTNANRRAALYLDVGRGLARDQATREEAVTWLQRAENTAPQWIRNYSPAREAVAFLLTRARATAGGRELRGMAARMGVPH